MAPLANLNGVSETLPAIPKLPCFQKTQKRTAILGLFHGNKTQEFQEQAAMQTTRRMAIGLASIALCGNVGGNGNSLADDNGYWLNGPLPKAQVKSKIANEETGTRSFLKTGIFTANIGTKSQAYRIRRYAFDLLALGDLIPRNAWNFFRMYLRNKASIMYYDFDVLISNSPENDKQPLTNLANRLFDNVEKLEEAVRKEDVPRTESCYQETTGILQEVMAQMEARDYRAPLSYPIVTYPK
ncbi:hypothetical protein Vadar_006595 [Vaccinium darrowii]|uniref:Uncharacterized protein n=1 Tax=Vaccinium darrowii TaxID=229202 RepID=A0ACB7XNM1_9ERIC|nr:hypothetical protein Vadar_006595 [Vaccinium darrowii]